MKNLVVLLGLAVVVGFGVYGCGGGTKARIEVAKNKALKQLDEMLGSMDVKRKETDLQVKEMKQGLAGLNNAKIKAHAAVHFHNHATSKRLPASNPTPSRTTRHHATLAKCEFAIDSQKAHISKPVYQPVLDA
jgi:hypothetical protein